MGKVLYQAVDSEGRETTDFLEADSLVDAERVLRWQGFVAIRFHTDPQVADSPTWSGPEATLRLHQRGLGVVQTLLLLLSLGFLLWMTESLVRSLLAQLGVHSTLASWVAASILVGAFCAVLVVPAFLHPAARRAIAWGRYARALPLMRATRFLARWGPGRVMDPLLRFEEATALAGLGRIAQAQALVRPLAEGSPKERALHERHLARLYDHAREFDEMLRVQREVAERHPDESTLWVDLALNTALRSQDYELARRTLDHCDGQPATEIARAGIGLASSICSLHERLVEQAQREVDEAQRIFTGVGRNADIQSFVALCRWQRARCLAATNRIPEAKAELAAARPMLLATGDHALLEDAAHSIDRGAGAAYREN